MGLRFKGLANSVNINFITEINYRCKYMQVFFKYKYNTILEISTIQYMYTISSLYQLINLNVST